MPSLASYDDNQRRAQARFLRSLGSDAEVFGLLGRGFPNSIYKAHVRRTPRSAWWVFDSGTARPVVYDPAAHHARMRERGGAGVVKAIRVPLSELARFEFMPGRESLRALFERAKELS